MRKFSIIGIFVRYILSIAKQVVNGTEIKMVVMLNGMTSLNFMLLIDM